jgi:hypothetical protein
LNPNFSYRNEENYDSNDLNDDNNDNIEYDGIETVNYYSNNHSFGKPPNNNNNFNSSSFSYGNTNNSNNNNNSNNPNNFSNSNNNSSLNKNNANSINVNSLNNSNSNNNNNNSTSDSYDPTMKLRYLEKSIKFIQQQHTETLTSLHQEIEKLKNENRGKAFIHIRFLSVSKLSKIVYFFILDLHFRLATRKSSDSISRPSSSKLNRNNVKNEPVDAKAFDKLLKESAKETDLNKRLNDIKQNYDQNKFDELVSKLKDAESKNEYLTSIITQLQARRTANSGYRPNISVNITNNSNNNANTNANNSNLVNSNNATNTTTANNNNPIVTKLNLNHICSIEPLRIRLSEKDEPRAPTVEESESIIKKLFELYKQQKQQVLIICFFM